VFEKLLSPCRVWKDINPPYTCRERDRKIG
jgi:hypothetical protein